MTHNNHIYSHKLAARIFGIFFLIAFLSYGIGSGLIDSIVSAPDYLTEISNNRTTIVFGACLIALIHTIVNIGLPVIMLPILKPYNKTLTYGYLGAGITGTILLAFGAIFLLLLLPLSEEYIKLGASNESNFETIGILLKKGGFYSYQIGMAIWGFGGLLLCYLLYISKLVPRLFSIWGFVGYTIFIAGTILELFGYELGVLLSIPGGLFEISMSLWLLIKGFRVSK
tara:strand:+ start:12614 stop:13294 length:681 start_codon:yes stop_codon:yes gene_type:complete